MEKMLTATSGGVDEEPLDLRIGCDGSVSLCHFVVFYCNSLTSASVLKSLLLFLNNRKNES